MGRIPASRGRRPDVRDEDRRAAQRQVEKTLCYPCETGILLSPARTAITLPAMLDGPDLLDMPLNGLAWDDWLNKLEQATEDDGYVEPLGRRHAAILVEKKPILLVTFETHQTISERSAKAHPLGWQMVGALGWSHLCLVSKGDTWFRDPWVYSYFDRLVDDGFFEDFEQVIFYGAGPCGYAAAAYSVAAPGARVVVLQPQATLDPDMTEWDSRFTRMRRATFDDRYGYAPDMLDAAETAFVLYDPEIQLDAMHAALFARPNVTRYRMRFVGQDMERALLRMNVLLRIFAQLSAGKLTRRTLAQIFRARRADKNYQHALLKRLTAENRHRLTLWLCRNILEQRDSPPVRKLLARAYGQLVRKEA